MFIRLFRCLCCNSGVTMVTLPMKMIIKHYIFLISNNCCVCNVVCILWWNREQHWVYGVLGYKTRYHWSHTSTKINSVFICSYRNYCQSWDHLSNRCHHGSQNYFLNPRLGITYCPACASWSVSAWELLWGGVGGFPRMCQCVGEVSKERFKQQRWIFLIPFRPFPLESL